MEPQRCFLARKAATEGGLLQTYLVWYLPWESKNELFLRSSLTRKNHDLTTNIGQPLFFDGLGSLGSKHHFSCSPLLPTGNFCYKRIDARKCKEVRKGLLLTGSISSDHPPLCRPETIWIVQGGQTRGVPGVRGILHQMVAVESKELVAFLFGMSNKCCFYSFFQGSGFEWFKMLGSERKTSSKPPFPRGSLITPFEDIAIFLVKKHIDKGSWCPALSASFSSCPNRWCSACHRLPGSNQFSTRPWPLLLLLKRLAKEFTSLLPYCCFPKTTPKTATSLSNQENQQKIAFKKIDPNMFLKKNGCLPINPSPLLSSPRSARPSVPAPGHSSGAAPPPWRRWPPRRSVRAGKRRPLVRWSSKDVRKKRFFLCFLLVISLLFGCLKELINYIF